MNAKTKALTTQQPFYVYEDAPMFSVNPGLPITNALEVATNLMLYSESLAAADAFVDKTLELGIIQHLSEMAKALNQACERAVKDCTA